MEKVEASSGSEADSTLPAVLVLVLELPSSAGLHCLYHLPPMQDEPWQHVWPWVHAPQVLTQESEEDGGAGVGSGASTMDATADADVCTAVGGAVAGGVVVGGAVVGGAVVGGAVAVSGTSSGTQDAGQWDESKACKKRGTQVCMPCVLLRQLVPPVDP